MRMKLLFKSPDAVNTFAEAVLFLARQAKRMVFCFTQDLVLLQIEKPFIYIELDVNVLAKTYDFIGMIFSEDEKVPHIFLDINTAQLIKIFQTFKQGTVIYLEIRIARKENNSITLQFQSTMRVQDNTIGGQLFFEMPTVFLPFVEFTSNDLQNELQFDYTLKMPSMFDLKRYIEIYNNFELIRILIVDTELSFEGRSSDAITSSRTVFTKYKPKCITIQNSSEEYFVKIPKKYEVQVTSNLVVNFIHTIKKMRFRGVELICKIKAKKMMQLSFVVPSREIRFNFLIQHMTDGDECQYSSSSDSDD